MHIPEKQAISNLHLHKCGLVWDVRCRDLAVPKRVEALQGVNVVLLSGGWRHAVAADDQGRMYGWGWNKV